MSDKIIQIQNVNKWFGDFQVLKDINLNVEQKQIQNGLVLLWKDMFLQL